MKRATRILLFAFVSILAFGMMGWLFYKEELKYMLPTPKPEGLAEVPIGAKVSTLAIVKGKRDKPLFLHFYNPHCQCSKFNAKHFAELVKGYDGKVVFYVVIQGDSPEMINDFTTKYKLNVPAILDESGAISDMFGIYSTPQAVLLDRNSVIYYKGNYNKARFCSSKETAFAEKALNCLLEGQKLPAFSEQATTAYGCTLPSDNTTKLY